MTQQYQDSFIVCEQTVHGTSAAILQLLSKSDRALTVPEIGDLLPDAYEDTKLYPIMRRLSHSGKLVTTTEIESRIRGHTQKRTAWEATPAVKEFFAQQSVSQQTTRSNQ